MATDSVDQVSAVKASLELMVSDNAEIHGYFKDLLEKVADLEDEAPEVRRAKFKDLEQQGAFRFHGVDVRRFTQTHHKPLPPPLFLSRTKRRLKNTITLVDEFAKRDLFAEADSLRMELDLLASSVLDEQSGTAVQDFKAKVDALRGSSVFVAYLDTKARFIRQDAELRADAAFIAAKESAEEGEELVRQRAEELSALSDQLAAGTLPLDEAQAMLESIAQQMPGAGTLTSQPAAPAKAKPQPQAEPRVEAFAEALDDLPPLTAEDPAKPAPDSEAGAKAPGAKPGAK